MSTWEALLDLQQHDTTIDQLEHRARMLPQRAELDDLTAGIGQLDTALAEVDGRRAELDRSLKRLEDEIASLRQKGEQVDGQLYGGTVTVPKDLQALQSELDHIRDRVRNLEDDELEIMERAEPVDAERERLEHERGRIDGGAAGVRAALTEAEAAIDAELDVVRAERDALAAMVSPELLAEYDRLRRRLGVAVARLTAGSCGGCHLKLSAVEIDRIRSLPVEETVHCEECGRLLVRG